MSQRVAVTGANGYIGRYVVQELLSRGHNVVAVTRGPADFDPKVTSVQGDVLVDERDWYEAAGRPDIVIHLAWRDGFSHNADSHLEDLPKHYRFLKRLVDSGLKRLVVMGSVHEVGYHEGAVDENTPANPRSAYGVAKNALRQILFSNINSADVTLQWIRGFYITGDDGANHSIFTKILEMDARGEKSFPFTDGEDMFDFIDVEELAKQIVSVSLQRDVVGVINCCSGVPCKIKDRVLRFLEENNLSIRPEFGGFPKRAYDSPIVYGDTVKIQKIMNGKCDA